MASKKYLVIVVLTLVAFTCAENSEPITSNSITTAEGGSIPATDNSSATAIETSPITENNVTSTTVNSSILTTENNTATTASSTTTATNETTAPNDANTTASANATTTITTNATTTSAANATKKVCVLIKLDLEFNNKTYKIASDDVINTVLTCSNQSSTIRWGKTLNSTISFHFKSDAEAKIFMISHITLTIDAVDNYANATVSADKPMELVFKSNGNFKVPIGKSYNYSVVETSFTGPQNGTSIKVITSNVQLEAFRNSSTHVFSSPMLCANDNKAPTSGLDTGFRC